MVFLGPADFDHIDPLIQYFWQTFVIIDFTTSDFTTSDFITSDFTTSCL